MIRLVSHVASQAFALRFCGTLARDAMLSSSTLNSTAIRLPERPPRVGELVEVRSRRWLVEAVEDVAPPASPRVSLACADDDAQGQTLEVYWDFEIDRRILEQEAWSGIGARGFDAPRHFGAFLHTLRWNCVTATDPNLFQSPFRAGIRIDAYQMEPLRKALRLPRVNLFIADDTGLGKTIEAGLIARELLLRKKVRTMVVAAPASVLEQWKAEMEERFGLLFVILDRGYLTRVRRERGFGVNPWRTHSRFLVSHNLLIDPTYADPMREWLGEMQPGSLLILDEAHHAAPSSGGRYGIETKFTRAVRDLGGRFEHRLFLSATPHNGHSNSFSTLLELLDPYRFTRGVPIRGRNALEDVMVRRIKEDVREVQGGFPEREVRRIPIDDLHEDAPELVLSRLLDEYRGLREERLKHAPARARAAAGLLVVGLQQKLLSSIEAFAISLARHRATVRRQWERAVAGGAAASSHGSALASARLFAMPPDADDERAGLSDDDQEAEEATQIAVINASAEVRTDGDAQAEAIRRKEEALLDRMQEVASAACGHPDAKTRCLIAWIRDNLCPNLPHHGQRPPGSAGVPPASGPEARAPGKAADPDRSSAAAQTPPGSAGVPPASGPKARAPGKAADPDWTSAAARRPAGCAGVPPATDRRSAFPGEPYSPDEPPTAAPPHWNERRVLIFTENVIGTKRYLREMLEQAIAGTHLAEERIETIDGQTVGAKRKEIQRRFNADPASDPLRILLATDAAREGLNFQAHCTDLFHFDLPWNPGRIEQRNGRIDRKLQPAPKVVCHYFVLPQREEDRVLEVLVRKTETIKRELGSLSKVIDDDIERRLRGGIRHRDAKRLAREIEAADLDRETRERKRVAAEELEAARERQEDLKAQIERCRGLLERSRRWVQFSAEPFRDALSCSLELTGAAPLREGRAEDGGAIWTFPPLSGKTRADASWTATLDTLRAPRRTHQKLAEWRREAPIRPVVFEDAGVLTDDTVHLHLEQRMAQRLLARFRAQGFVHHDLSRACLVQAADSIPRVVLLGRLCLFGRRAERLHEVLVPVAARWSEPSRRTGPLKAYAEEAEARTLERLESALQKARAPGETIHRRLLESAARDIEDLLPQLEERAELVAENAAERLRGRGEREQRQLRETLEGQRERVEAELRRHEGGGIQLTIEFSEEERRQRQADIASWRTRLAQFDRDLETEPGRIRAFYEVRARRVEPIGLVYLWPDTG